MALTPGPGTSDSVASRRAAWALLVAYATIAALGVALAYRPLSDPDTFWHLAVGRYIDDQGALPRQNLWSFTAPQHPFAATSWLFGWCIFKLWVFGDYAAVQALVAGLTSLTFCLVLWLALRRGAGLFAAFGATALALVTSAPRLTPRPHMVSYVGLAALAHLLFGARSGRRQRGIFLVPPLICVWANFHAGAIFGVALVGLYAAAEIWTALRSEEGPRPVARRRAVAALVLLGASGLAFLCNPAGTGLGGYAWEHLTHIDQVVALQEFMVPPPSRYPGFYLTLAAVLALGVAHRSRVDPFDVLVCVAFGVLGFKALRVVPKALILATPVLASWFECRVETLRAKGVNPWFLRASGVAWLSLTPLLGLWSPGQVVARMGAGLDDAAISEPAAKWIEANRIEGRVFTGFDLGGFVIWRLPDSRVFLDPRLLAYPRELFLELEKVEGDPAAFDRVLEAHGAEWAFVSERKLRLSGYGMFLPLKWALVYWDGAARVYLRRHVARFASVIAAQEQRMFLPPGRVATGFDMQTPAARRLLLEELERGASVAPHNLAVQLALCSELVLAGDGARANEHCNAARARYSRIVRLHPELIGFWEPRLNRTLRLSERAPATSTP
jgi:hypothetical protein